MTDKLTDLSSVYTKYRKNIFEFFVIFYGIGTVGTILPFTRGVFMALFPFALLLSFFALFACNEKQPGTRLSLTAALIAVAGFFIEVTGVNTGYIFGSYTYGKTLGPGILHTPLMIGLNWSFLVFATASITGKPGLHPVIQILAASLMMVLYDFLIEHTAADLEMWTWNDSLVPVRNYIAWFIIAVIMHIVLRLLHVRPRLSLAPLILSCQAAFFLLLAIYFKLIM